MEPEAPFILTRATAEDMTDIVDVCYDSFPPQEVTVFMGCKTKQDLPKIRQKYVERTKSDVSDVWIVVRETATKRLVAASNWKVYVNGEPDDLGDEPPAWLDADDFARSSKVLKALNDHRRRSMREAYIHLHICFTHPDYRRRGSGGMMLQWGCDLADSLSLPMWIEASEQGNLLYAAYGFYVHERVVNEGIPAAIMKRDARNGGIQGGKIPKV